jgi:hypothetical protein
MQSAYKVFAYLVAALVVVQAMMIAFAIAGLGVWVDKEGGVLDKASMESDLEFTGVLGFAIHGMNGMMLIPAVALVFLIVSFFAKVPGGIVWAAVTLLLVVVQITLGLLGHENPYFGMVHGLNALILFSVAVMAGKRVNTATAASTRAAGTHAAA